ncbi:Hypothetical predicted protein, partial [Pelobates cultripes]
HSGEDGRQVTSPPASLSHGAHKQHGWRVRRGACLSYCCWRKMEGEKHQTVQ